MSHNKSVEEALADVLCEEIMVSPKDKAEKTIKATLIKAYQYGQRQASQEREREIVKEILNSVGFYNDGCGCCMEETAEVQINNIAQKYNITLTNPNKD